MGAAYRLDAVRHRLRRRPADAAQHAAGLSPARSRRSSDAGYEFFAGLEVEFHLFKLEKAHLGLGDAAQPGQPGAPPEVSLLNQGYQYLTESRYDEMDPILEILRTNIAGLALPLRSLEVEFGPSQVEFTFRAGTGLHPADAMVLFRSATKQVAQRNGYHATFMCRPKLPNVMSSGWHLHQSLKDRRAAPTPSPIRRSRCRRSACSGWRACSTMRAPRPRSRRRRSTATSATAPSRSRPTARSGAATIAA